MRGFPAAIWLMLIIASSPVAASAAPAGPNLAACPPLAPEANEDLQRKGSLPVPAALGDAGDPAMAARIHFAAWPGDKRWKLVRGACVSI